MIKNRISQCGFGPSKWRKTVDIKDTPEEAKGRERREGLRRLRLDDYVNRGLKGSGEEYQSEIQESGDGWGDATVHEQYNKRNTK